MRLRLRELPRVSLSYGLRWESDEGGAAVFDVVDHNIDGRGLTLGLRALVSGNDDSVRLYSRLPRVFGSKASLELFVEGRRETSDGILTDSLESTLQFSFPLGPRSTGRTYGRWRERHVTEENPDPFFPIDITITSPFLGFQYIHDSRDSPLAATRGRFTSLDFSGSEEFLGSDFKYARFFAWTSLFRSAGRVGGRPLRWAQSYRLGLAEPFDNQVLIPDEQIRFFAGGAYSVRGYPTESLGPVSDLFGPLGGEALIVINQELRMALPFALTGVAFFDAGNVWAEREDIGLDLKSAIGLGLRWASPIGILRVDVAGPLNRRPDDSAYQAYFGFGHVF